MNLRQEQELVLERIRQAVEKGEYAKAEVIRKASEPILKAKLPPLPEPERIPASPINVIPL